MWSRPMSSLGVALQRINQLENTLTALGYPRCMCHPIEDDGEYCLPSPAQWLAERDALIAEQTRITDMSPQDKEKE